jgi:hypothetical protein
VKTTARCLIAAISICAWFAISNHCAIQALASKTEQTASGCPFHSKPAKPQPPQPTECCKILHAVASAPAKNLAPAIVDLANVDLGFAEFVVIPPPKIFFAPGTLDTGPPGKTSFAELNRSMRAHAPPSRA